MMLVCIVFILMWTFQVLLLGQFYEIMKVSSISKATKELAKSYNTESFAESLHSAAIKNDMCIEVLNESGAEIDYQCIFSGNCMLHNGSNDIYFYYMDLKQNQDGEIVRKLYNETMQS